MTEPLLTSIGTSDKLTVTLKGPGANTPWAVFHLSSMDDAAATLRQFDPSVGDALDAFDLGLAIAQASVHFQAKVSAASGLGAVPVVMEKPPTPPLEVPATPAAPLATWGSAPNPAASWPTPQEQHAQPQYAQPPAQAPQQYAQPPAQPQQYAQPAQASPPPPGPAPIGQSGFTMVWKTGISTKNNRPYRGWMSGQPKANIDAGQPKDQTIWID